MLRPTSGLGAFTLFFAVMASCGGAPARQVVDGRSVSAATGAPTIRGVTDLGGVRAVPVDKPVPVTGADGVYAVGEWLLVEGSSFGRQPTIAISSKPAPVLARTGNGGIVTRVPPEVARGKATVEVSNRRGRSTADIVISRYVAIAGPKQVSLAALGGGAPAHTVALPGATALAAHHRGDTLYALTNDTITPIVIPGTPRLGDSAPAKGATHIATAATADRMAAVGGGRALIYNTASSSRPRLVGQLTVAGRAVDAAMSANGELLVVLIAEGNRLVLVDCKNPTTPRALPALPLIDGESASLVVGLAMLPGDGEAVVIAHEAPPGMLARPTGTRLLEVSLSPAPKVVHRALAPVGAPVQVRVARHARIGSATAVGSNKKRALIVLATRKTAIAGQKVSTTGTVLSIDLDGNAQPLATGDARLASAPLAITTGSQVVIAAKAAVGAIAVTPADDHNRLPQTTVLDRGAEGAPIVIVP